MSYNGTVRCGHCYEPGHNRLGCPERRRAAQKDPEGYIGRQWHREQAARKLQIESRVCSYCKEPNHNRRGCKTLKEDKRLIAERQQEYRREVFHATSSAGFGPGALVKVPKGNHGDDGGVWSKGTVEMVTEINWSQVDFLLKDTDISRDWRVRDRQLARTRIVSTFGYDEGDYGYRGPPKHNDVGDLKALQLLNILPSIFADNTNYNEDNDRAAQLVGPVGFVNMCPGDLEPISRYLNDSFNLTPDSRADEYAKRRASLASTQWSVIRKSEHEKHETERY